jgi:transcriptional regulator with XRE-family HTH domain
MSTLIGDYLSEVVRMSAATLLRAARQATGLSQRSLAARAGRRQPQIADVERGKHDVTVDVLTELLAATGHRLVAVPSTRTSAADAAAAIRRALVAGQHDRALREALQLSDDLASSEPVVRAALCAAAPELSGDQRYDALIAGIVEFHLPRASRPSWVLEENRALKGRWYVDDTPGLAELNLAETPPALLRHGVVLAASELASV